jgi:DnaJ family protein A protein 2
MKKDITLIEALTGFEFTLTHLDGHEYIIYSKKGEVISDKAKKVVGGLGMPLYKNSLSHGNLIIEFHVLMPKRGTLDADQLKQLAELLPGKVNPRPADDKYEMMEDFRKEETNTSEMGGHKK